MKAVFIAFAACMMAGAALALDFPPSSTSNAVQYHGGVTEPVATGGSAITTYAMITHTITADLSITQNGAPAADLVSGPADAVVRLRTSATMGYVLSASDNDPSRTGNVEKADITPRFDDMADYAYLDSAYPACIMSAGYISTLEGLHAINFKINNKYWCSQTGGYCSAICTHTLNNPTAISMHYNPTGIPADSNPAGKGNGYLYCNGSLFLNGNEIGSITGNDQTFSAKINLADGQTTVQVSAKYTCYFVTELYYADGSKQSGVNSVENVNHQMQGGVPLTQTVIIPINRVTPPQINMVPLIILNNTYYSQGAPPITVNTPNTRFHITFLVNRTDTITLIEVPYLNWSLYSTPPELITTTYMNFPLTPPLIVGPPSRLVPPGKTPPITITVCRPGVVTDTVTLEVNTGRSITESSYDDNIITLTFDCSGIGKPKCRFTPGNLITYPGQAWMANMSCYDRISYEPVDCPMWNDATITHSNGDFLSHYQPLAWTYDSTENATNLVYVTAKGSTNPDEASYSDTVTATFPGYSPAFGCDFNLDWRRPDCRYFM
jgi:hypothetical protein